MILKNLVIQENEFDVFLGLTPTNKIEFLWDALHIGAHNSGVKQMSKQRADYEYDMESQPVLVSVSELRLGPHILTVMSVERLLVLSSDNLTVIRKFVNHLWSCGQIMRRRKDIRKDTSVVLPTDLPKYFIAYQIIGQMQPICEN